MTEDARPAWKGLTDQIEVAGSQLVAEIHRLLAEGNVRKLVIKSEEGDLILSIPLSGGAIAGGIVALTAPWIAVIAAIAGVLARVRIEVIRYEESKATDPKAPAATDS